VSLISDAIYSYDVTGARLRLTVLRSPVYAHHTPKILEANTEYDWMDQGRHTLRYAVLPHAGSWQAAGTQRLAEMLNMPSLSQAEGVHAGRLPATAEFLSVDQPNVLVTVLKQAEQSEGLIIRAQETAGQQTSATLNVSLIERVFQIDMGPWQVKTWRVSEADGMRETNFLEG